MEGGETTIAKKIQAIRLGEFQYLSVMGRNDLHVRTTDSRKQTLWQSVLVLFALRQAKSAPSSPAPTVARLLGRCCRMTPDWE